LIDFLLDIHAALAETGVPVHTPRPAAFAQLPCILLSETANEVFASADALPHLHEVEYTLESWAASLERTHALAAQIDEKLTALGFRRTYCCDLFDDGTQAHRRVMRYRALYDNHCILTQ